MPTDLVHLCFPYPLEDLSLTGFTYKGILSIKIRLNL
jgi:hypothetical protein